MLDYAYRCCKANKGAAGVDGQRFEDIEAYGVERWLGEQSLFFEGLSNLRVIQFKREFSDPFDGLVRVAQSLCNWQR